MNTVKIGNQEWAQENLNIDHFQNGDLIQHAKTKDEWKLANENKQAAWCFNLNEATNELKSGRLYNFYTILDPRMIAPDGFHVPAIEEWEILIHFLGGFDTAGFKLKSINGFSGSNAGATNESGFTAVAGGDRKVGGTFFDSERTYGLWWTSSLWHGEASGLYKNLDGTLNNDLAYAIRLESAYGEALKKSIEFGCGLSIRCLKNP
jgi:uncharacterized protein (TIGR02145 family)